MPVVIRELPIPTGVGAPGWSDFVATVEARNAAQEAAYGAIAHYRPEELILGWTDPDEPKRLLAAEVDGRIVARAYLEWTSSAEPDFAWHAVEVDPAFARRGIGRALADALEELALGLGRTRAQAFVGHIDDGSPPRLPAPTGFGSVPAEERSARFLLSRGWTLGQIERGSRLALPVDPAGLAERLAVARERSGDDYRVHRWVARTPERWLGDLAELLTRMGTDIPHGDLDEVPDVWSVERIRERELAEAEGPRTRLTVGVEHVPTGRLVGFTDLDAPAELDRPIDQGDTIVVSEHRGRRLGMLLKLEGLALVADAAPGHPAIHTFNAEENRHMLDVNEAVGFRPYVVEGGWRKTLGT